MKHVPENELNELPEEVKTMSTNKLTKYLINEYKIFNGSKYFFKEYGSIYFFLTQLQFFRGISWVSGESIENIITKTENFFVPTWYNYYPLRIIKIYGHCLLNNNSFTPRKVINRSISNIIDTLPRDLNIDLILNTCLFGSVELTKNADWDKYKINGYGIAFESSSKFSLADGSMGKNVIIFRVGVGSSVHVDNKRKNILNLAEGIDDTRLTAEAKYPINFPESGKDYTLCLGNISNILQLTIWKKRN